MVRVELEMSPGRNIPPKVLRKILELIPDSELASVKNVCKSWHDIIDQEIGIPVHLGNGNRISSLHNVTWNPVRIISHIGISRAIFSDIDEELPVLGFKYPNLVKELSFDGFISEKSFAKLIVQLPNLQIIKIHTSTLCFLRSDYLRDWDLPLLKSLHIVSYGSFGNEAWSYTNDQILDSTGIILKSNQFPRLEQLILNMLFIPRRENELNDAILRCLLTHKQTLRIVGMEFNFEGESNDQDEDEVTFDPSEWLRRLSGLQLEGFSLQFYYNGSPRTKFWKEFLTSQKRIGKVDYICGEGMVPFPVGLIQRNHSSLVQIHLKIHIPDVQFDCSVFQDCSMLRKLALFNKSQSSRYIMEENFPILKNPTHLPRTIHSLMVAHFKIWTMDASWIAFELDELEELFWSCIGTKEEYGFLAMDLLNLLDIKKLKKLTIIGGLNTRSIADLEFEPHSRLVWLILTTIGADIDCVLDGNGNYDRPEVSILDVRFDSTGNINRNNNCNALGVSRSIRFS